MSYKFGATKRKDRIAARFLGQVHAVISRAAYEAKKEHGITQAQVARELDIGRATISRLLSGAGNPTIRTIGELVGVLGYRPELVLRRVEERPGENHGPIVVTGTTVIGTPRNKTAGGTKTAAYVHRPKTMTAESMEAS